MNIGVFSTHVLWNTHYETELEVIQKHLKNEDTVYHFTCSENLNHCEMIFFEAQKQNKSYHDLKKVYCPWCIKRKKIGWNLLEGKVIECKLLENPTQEIELPDLWYFKNHENLKKLYHENYDIGWSLLSSLISFTQNPYVDLSKYLDELSNNYKDCIRIYQETKNKISELDLDYIYCFNGRFSYTKSIFRAAQSLGIDCYILERGSTNQKYGCFKNHLPHDIEMFSVNANELWSQEPDEAKKNRIAENFYQNRRSGIIGSWHSMIDLQRDGLMPENWVNNKVNITFFTSSDDEFSSIDEAWNNPYFNDQFETVQFLLEILNDEVFSNFHLYVRIHPNAKRLGLAYVKKFLSFNNTNITIITPESSVSTYALMDNSNIIITSGSTTGYEAVFAKKYTVQLGKSLYYKLQGPINPVDKSEIPSLLLNNQNLTHVPLDTIKLGYYMNTYGIPYQYYKPLNHLQGTFKGVDVCKESLKTPKSLKNRVKNKIKFLLKSIRLFM